jgi:hypothetical protein
MTALEGRETHPLLEGFATLNSRTNDIASSTKPTCPLLEEKDKLILFRIHVSQNMENSTLHKCDLPLW